MKTKLLLTGVVAALAIAPAANAFEAKISGQVNSAAVFGGDTDDLTVVDNNTSGSRFRFVAKKDIGAGMSAGLRYEMQDQDNVSSSLADRADTEVRVSDVYVKGAFGKVAIGKGSRVSDGSFEAYGIVNYMGGAESWLLYSGTTDVAYRSRDGLSRGNRVRYDSPSFGGFSFAFNLHSGGGEGFAANYKGKFGGTTVIARYAIDELDSGSKDDYSGGSIAVKFPFGLSLAYSDAERDQTNAETGAVSTLNSNWFQAGYTFGKATISIGTGESGVGVDNEMTIFGVNYKPVKGMEIYANYMDFDNDGGTSGDTMSFGSRIKF